RRRGGGPAEAGGGRRAPDFESFAAEAGEPLSGRFADVTILTSPPNSAGVLLLQALACLDAAGLGASALARDAGLLAELLRLGMRQRDRELADPALARFDRDALRGRERIDELVPGARRAALGRAPE